MLYLQACLILKGNKWMFNFGLSEIALIAIVAVLVIGPKELPLVMAHVGRLLKRLSYMRFAASQQMDHFLNSAGLGDVKDQVNFEAPSPADAHKAALEEAKKQALPKPAPTGKAKPKAATKAKTKAKAKPAAKTAAAKPRKRVNAKAKTEGGDA